MADAGRGLLLCIPPKLQHLIGVRGSLLEIGVFQGKFLSLLHYIGRRHGNVTVGIDIFSHSRPELTISHARALFGTAEDLVLHELNSADLSPSRALELLEGMPPRAVSIDGDHRADGVLKDLRMASVILADRGVLIIDDVLNPTAIGVAEGAFRFLVEPNCEIVPFAYIANKMFACRRGDYEIYLEASRRFTVDCSDLPVAQRFRPSRAQGTHRVEQEFLGSRILIFD